MIFDNQIEKKVVMKKSRDEFTKVKLEPAPVSKTLRVTVTSVYASGGNGFAEIKVFAKTCEKFKKNRISSWMQT